MDRRMMLQGAGGKSDMNGWTDGVAYTDLTVVKNSYVKASNGAFTAYSGWDRTSYVPCDGCSSITFPPCPQGAGTPDSNRFYDANKVVVGGNTDNFSLSKTVSTTITVPATAAYFAISSEAAALASCINAGIVPHA